MPWMLEMNGPWSRNPNRLLSEADKTNCEKLSSSSEPLPRSTIDESNCEPSNAVIPSELGIESQRVMKRMSCVVEIFWMREIRVAKSNASPREQPYRYNPCSSTSPGSDWLFHSQCGGLTINQIRGGGESRRTRRVLKMARIRNGVF